MTVASTLGCQFTNCQVFTINYYKFSKHNLATFSAKILTEIMQTLLFQNRKIVFRSLKKCLAVYLE